MTGHLFFCSRCGEVYAKIPLLAGEYIGHRMRCLACGPECLYWSWPGGSVWLDWDQEFLTSLPPEVIKREFELHLNAASQIEADNDSSDISRA